MDAEQDDIGREAHSFEAEHVNHEVSGVTVYPISMVTSSMRQNLRARHRDRAGMPTGAAPVALADERAPLQDASHWDKRCAISLYFA